MSKRSPAACSGASNWRKDCCIIPACCCLTSRRLGLIPARAAILWQYLQILRDEEHVSVLVTTHLMEEAERCDRLAIMNEGNLVALGTPAELKSEIGGDVICWMPRTMPACSPSISRRAFALKPQ